MKVWHKVFKRSKTIGLSGHGDKSTHIDHRQLGDPLPFKIVHTNIIVFYWYGFFLKFKDHVTAGGFDQSIQNSCQYSLLSSLALW